MNVDMSNVYVEKYNVSTVSAALGYSFTAGTADGIAFGMEYQGMTEVIFSSFFSLSSFSLLFSSN